MCGIAGWVDFDRDLTRERVIAEGMTQTMHHRGPDDSGLWLAPQAALGHRRLSIIDLKGGRQPMVAQEEGKPVAVLVYTGEVYNFRELRSELVSLGRTFRTQSDTEVVLEAYRHWGEAFVERLNGMYAFALWNVREQRLLLVRDRMGIKPLYYYPTPHGVLFGSEPKAILANPRIQAQVDEDGLREVLAFIKTPGEAIFRGMREVRPGHVVTVTRGGLQDRTYWRLEARPHTDDLKTTVRTVRELLEDIVARQLISDVPLCTLLSGGLDSSVITALAQRALMAQGAGPVRSFAVDFVHNARDFTPDEIRATPDAPFVADVAAHVHSHHTDIVLSAGELADPQVRATVLHARDVPISLGDLDTSMYLLFRAIRQHSTVALSGESADEVFGGYAWFHHPQAIAANTFPWHSMPLQLFGVPEYALAPGLLLRLNMKAYLQARYQEALAEVPRLAGERGLERRMREVFYLHLTRFLQVLLDRKDRTSMATGLEVRVPFCDHRLVEYLFNVPWSMKTFDGKEKSLLRAATADLLPKSVLERRKSPYPSTKDPEYTHLLRGQFTAMLDKAHAPVKPMLNAAHSRILAHEPLENAPPWTRLSLEQVLMLNAWLEDYGVKQVSSPSGVPGAPTNAVRERAGEPMPGL
ncbi:asparagine synthase (glutamine-hydrolyzing) [Stigmatella aurantiaca]|uniref:asparagine synthase (glutamine-hydrolyzing) n=1 Tax=Stigmatella aurantiaca (strain DW4/3-1) TaxID=378806 RepID=Q094S0_STIAD|nr:asparagine synthase (glutamine-hydrolyzing) [Stigmatella aurantiaca]ADO73252.1 Asparagine synthase (Glutamine-hydrolyzing) [Stigmatella aurantiaca DW4/3-1]EAU67218.1 asparagine synthase (glutamine-hydrolyzing) [Stigmatella aurantiaca DW4/3-1]